MDLKMKSHTWRKRCVSSVRWNVASISSTCSVVCVCVCVFVSLLVTVHSHEHHSTPCSPFSTSILLQPYYVANSTVVNKHGLRFFGETHTLSLTLNTTKPLLLKCCLNEKCLYIRPIKQKNYIISRCVYLKMLIHGTIVYTLNIQV